MRARVLAGLGAAALLAGTVGPAAARTQAAPALPLAPGCHHATFTENSGAGPTYRVIFCYFRHQRGTPWVQTVDGSPLQNGAVIYVPRPG